MLPICHVQLLPILSGVQRAMLEIFRHLDRRRYAPHVVCQAPGPLTEALEQLAIPCHIVPALRRSIHPWHDARALSALTTLFRRERFALVHTHSSKPGVLGRVAARRAGVPCVVHHVHSFAFHEFSPRWQRTLYAGLERFAGGFCDHVIFVNHEERLLAVREGLLPAEKCVTVHNGIDLAPCSPAQRIPCRLDERRARGWSEGTVVLLVSGRLDPQKQPLILADIVAGLAARRLEIPWRLAIAGEGSLRGALTARLHALGVADRVDFLGWLDAPHRALHAADIMVQPSLWEGLPLSLIEGQAAGLPAVASDVKGNREVIVPETGALVAPRSSAAYVDVLARWIVDPARREALGTAARARAAHCFNGDVQMRQIAELYESWLPAASPSRAQAA